MRAVAVCPGGSIDNNDACYDLKDPKSYTKLGYAEVIPEGAYYFNNREFGRYLKNTSGTADAQSGLLSNLGFDIQWVLTQFSDGYAIQNSGDTTKMLAVPSDYTSDIVILSEPDVLGPYNYVWDIIVAGNGCFLKSRHNNRYLYIDANGNLKTRVAGGQYYYDETSGTYVDTTAEASWRIVDVEEYGSGLTYGEESGNTSFKNIIIKQGQTHAIEVATKIPLNAIWCEPSDFDIVLNIRELPLIILLTQLQARVLVLHLCVRCIKSRDARHIILRVMCVNMLLKLIANMIQDLF